MAGSGSREVAERVARGMVAAWRARVSHLDGHSIHEHDGVVAALSGLPDPELSVALIEREPADALEALGRAEESFRSHGGSIGVDVERGRHRSVDRAIETMRLERVVSRPAMAVAIPRIDEPRARPGLEIDRVRDAEDLAAMAAIEAGSFGTSPEVAARIFAPGVLEREDVALYLARFEGQAVAMAYVHAFDGALGIFGVATSPAWRRRGFGTAVTAFAIGDAERAELAWLQPSEMGEPVYAAMGFEPVATWDVWIRPSTP